MRGLLRWPACYSFGMERQFYYHPERQIQVTDLIVAGEVRADQTIPCAYIPLEDGDGKAIVGWWIETCDPEDFFLKPVPAIPQAYFDYQKTMNELAQRLCGVQL